MSGRSPTLKAIQAFLLPRTSEVAVMFLSITHPNMPQPLNIVNSKAILTSNGVTYQPRAFEATLPAMSKGDLSTVTVTIDDADRYCAYLYRSIIKFDYPKAVLSVALVSDPNNPIWQSNNFRQKDVTMSVSGGAQLLTLTLGYADILNESYPSRKYDPTTYPGLFGVFK